MAVIVPIQRMTIDNLLEIVAIHDVLERLAIDLKEEEAHSEEEKEVALEEEKEVALEEEKEVSKEADKEVAKDYTDPHKRLWTNLPF